MRTATRWLFLVLAVAAGLALAHPAAHGQAGSYDPTHYWTYTILNPANGPFLIHATDQFIPMTPLQVTRSVKLLNWVSKDNSPVPDTLRHFVWWDLQPKLPVSQFVEITNQFGTVNVGVDGLDFLLAPAWKNQQHPVSPQWDHYLCYRAQAPASFNGVRTFRDEWRVDQQPVYDLRYICNPCRKEHNGEVFGIKDPITHFAVYAVNPMSDYFYPPVFDQFLSQLYNVYQYPTEWLFVPSLKRDVPTPAKKDSWGRLKTLYR